MPHKTPVGGPQWQQPRVGSVPLEIQISPDFRAIQEQNTLFSPFNQTQAVTNENMESTINPNGATMPMGSILQSPMQNTLTNNNPQQQYQPLMNPDGTPFQNSNNYGGMQYPMSMSPEDAMALQSSGLSY
jgi:hypothetical protein